MNGLFYQFSTTLIDLVKKTLWMLVCYAQLLTDLTD